MWRHGKTLVVRGVAAASVMEFVVKSNENDKHRLPRTPLKLKETLEKTNDLQDLVKTGLDNLSPETKQILQYSIPGLEMGRPLDKVMIVLVGETGTGKSNTINVLFDDPELCPTSDTESQTSKVYECTKSLQIQTEKPQLLADLIFVDLPGSSDTNHDNEKENLAKILNYRKTNVNFRSREIENRIPLPIKIRSSVYPNLVLLLVNASDKRMLGTDSNFQKSLKILKACDFVDNKQRNLIVIATNAIGLGTAEKAYKENCAKVTANIQKSVRDMFSINLVPVVFVENKPEFFGLEKPPNSDFYKLPDGTMSHANLIEVMHKTFQANHDKLGLLLTSWYFRSNCPDRQVKAISVEAKISPDSESFADDMTSAAKLIAELNLIQSENPDSPNQIRLFSFESLGYGYCPVTESVKSHYVFKDDPNLKTVQIGKSKFRVPEFIKFRPEHYQPQCISSETKEIYETTKLQTYGLESGIKLNVEVPPTGRWFSSLPNGKNVISVINEIRSASFHIVNPEKHLSEDLIRDIQTLPVNKSYKDEPEKFNQFVAKWGTHFVINQFVGGSIKLDCTPKTPVSDETFLSSVKVATDLLYEATGRSSFDVESASKKLKFVGISDERLIIVGGDSSQPMYTSLEDIQSDLFMKWKSTVDSDPKELEHSLQLYPYYDLKQCSNPTALKEATLGYLSQKVKAVESVRRDDIATKGQEAAHAIRPAGRNCFPGSTIVDTTFGPKLIAKLENGDILTTVHRNNGSVLFSLNESPFRTFLHQERISATFLEFVFSNRKTLRVTGEHLLLMLDSDKKLKPKQASQFKIGDSLIYVDENGNISTPQICSIGTQELEGIFAPATDSGTFLADGFLVTCYADIESFTVAHAAMTPLLWWYRIRNFFSWVGWTSQKSVESIDVDLAHQSGIHDYAQFLIILRENFPILRTFI